MARSMGGSTGLLRPIRSGQPMVTRAVLREARDPAPREERAGHEWEDPEDAVVQQLCRLATQPERPEGQAPGRRPDEGPRETAPEWRRCRRPLRGRPWL